MQPWQEEVIIIKWLIVGLLIVLIISISFIILMKINHSTYLRSNQKIKELEKDYQKNLELTSIITRESERQRIGSDLHDSVISSLNVLYLKSQIGMKEENLIDNIQETISLTRKIAHDLNPPLLEYQTIEDALRNILNQWITFYKIDIKINFFETFDLSTEQKKHLIRILQELMSNIHKHAQCTCIQFHLRLSKKFLTILLKDNGVGFGHEDNLKGLGLKNIETRINILRGIFKFKKRLPEGTIFLLLINK